MEKLCLDLHALFKYSAARREDFKEVQLELGLELHNFQQHTEVRWLSMGPAIDRIVEQWDAVTYFVAELAKDPKKVPKSINYKRIHMMLGTKEKATTKVTLQFFRNIIPLFEQFLQLFQKASPIVHILYDSICDILKKLLRRFMKAEATEKRYGSDLMSVESTNLCHQLPDKELVIGHSTRQALSHLTSSEQKSALLGMRSFLNTTS